MSVALPGNSENGDGGAAPDAWRVWARRVVLALWLPLILAAVAAPIAGLLLPQQPGPAGNPIERVGLTPVAPFRPLSAQALASGVRFGDTIVAVDGIPLAGGGAVGPTAELAALLDGPDGTAVRLTTRSTDGTIREHTLSRTGANAAAALSDAGIPPRARDWFFYVILVAASFALTAAAVLLFIRGRQRVVPMLLSFGLSIMSITVINLDVLAAAGLPIGLPMLTAGFTLLMLAVMLFPGGTFHPRWMRWVALLLVLLTPLGMFGIITTAWPIIHTGFLVAAVASLVARYRHLPGGAERQQIRWALFGFGVAAVLMVPTQVIEFFVLPRDLPLATWLWSYTVRNALNILLLLSAAGGLIVSLLRFRLYDADAVIARSVSLGTLALVLVALFAGTERVIELLGEELFHEELGVLAGGVGAAVAALMVVPIHHRLSHWAEHRFQRQLNQLRHGLPALVGDLRESAPVARIAAASLDWITRGVHASRAALVLGNRVVDARGIDAQEVDAWWNGWTPALEPGLDSDRRDSLFPLRIPLEADGHGRVGWLLLGPRPDGSFYGKDERETLAQIADPIARALEIAERRERREATESERWREQEALNGEIKAVNAELVRVLGSLDSKLERLVPAPGASLPAARSRARARRPTAQ